MFSFTPSLCSYHCGSFLSVHCCLDLWPQCVDVWSLTPPNDLWCLTPLSVSCLCRSLGVFFCWDDWATRVERSEVRHSLLWRQRTLWAKHHETILSGPFDCQGINVYFFDTEPETHWIGSNVLTTPYLFLILKFGKTGPCVYRRSGRTFNFWWIWWYLFRVYGFSE